MTAPNTNVAWTVGSVHAIRWQHNLGARESVTIEINRNAGATWTPLASDAANANNTSGNGAWTVTGPATSAALVRVSWAPGAVHDVSDSTFRVR